jgi:hypothetical protein
VTISPRRNRTVPASYRIDTDAGVVFTTLEGVVPLAELRDLQRALAADPLLNSSMKSLIDLTNVTDLQLSGIDVRNLAGSGAFSLTAQRAIVASTDAAFGMGRMYEILSEGRSDRTGVFRTMAEARAWLGLS